ncbi:MAG TPA: flagellar basal body rod protein FlgB [Xanthobacteraceae bacterium]|jgi:flagellar basal-body rod protein FlgB|nr:flagellar basal body rod protein FlgB [Xanthobacteraceae bacterium]
MPISDIPILAMLRTRMAWHQERQRVLADNVANADTPKFRPRDLVPPDVSRAAPAAGPVTLVRTDPMHLSAAGAGGGSQFAAETRGHYQVRPTGNAVNLEDEMMKVAANQMDYQMVTTLYSRGLGLIKTALGKG